MQKFLIALLLTLALLLPAAAVQAQDSISFSSVEVELWPEYDNPGVLVIYHITLSASTTLPTAISLRIPAAAGEPNAVALQQPDGQLFNVQYQRQTSGEWQTISFTASMPEIQLEYYDPGLQKNGNQRNYTYSWPADHAVDSLRLRLQQPLDGSQANITPGPVTSTVGGDGLTYIAKQIGAVPLNQAFDLEASYQKASDALTVEAQPVQPSEPLPTTPTWQTGLLTSLPWLLGVLGLGLIGGGIYWYWRSGQQVSKPRAHRGRASSASSASTTIASSIIYCHSCGNRAEPNDLFCRACGTKLRIE